MRIVAIEEGTPDEPLVHQRAGYPKFSSSQAAFCRNANTRLFGARNRRLRQTSGMRWRRVRGVFGTLNTLWRVNRRHWCSGGERRTPFRSRVSFVLFSVRHESVAFVHTHGPNNTRMQQICTSPQTNKKKRHAFASTPAVRRCNLRDVSTTLVKNAAGYQQATVIQFNEQSCLCESFFKASQGRA